MIFSFYLPYNLLVVAAVAEAADVRKQHHHGGEHNSQSATQREREKNNNKIKRCHNASILTSADGCLTHTLSRKAACWKIFTRAVVKGTFLTLIDHDARKNLHSNVNRFVYESVRNAMMLMGGLSFMAIKSLELIFYQPKQGFKL